MRSVPVFNRTEIAFLPGDGIAGAHTTVLDARHVYFAGEATYKEDSYTVHGALLSGMREARGIAKWWLENAEEAIRWQL